MAEQVTLGTFNTLQNSSIISTLNANNTLIEDAFEDCVSLSGTQPNAMQANLDMNSNQIINLPAPSTVNSPVRLRDIQNPIVGTIPINLLPDIVTPQQYGAIGNGIADDTAAILAAEAARQSGGTLYWPAGTYKITAPISVTKPGSWNLDGCIINSTAGPFLLKSSNFTLNGGKSTFNYTPTLSLNRAIRINPLGSNTSSGPGPTGTFTVSGSIAVGDASFTAGNSSDAATLNPSGGDWIYVVYDNVGGWPQSEIKQVTSVSGTTINVSSSFGQPFTFGAIQKLGAVTGGSGYAGGGSSIFNNVPLTGGSGTLATANIIVTGGVVTYAALINIGKNYIAGDTLSASNTDLGGAGTGFSIPVSNIWPLGWVKFTNVLQNIEVNSLNIVIPIGAPAVSIGLDCQTGTINPVVKNNTFNIGNGLAMFIATSISMQILNNIIHREVSRFCEFSQNQGGLISGNSWLSEKGIVLSGGLSLNSGGFGTTVTNNSFVGRVGSGIVNINDVSGCIFDNNIVVGGDSGAGIGVLISGGLNNTVSNNTVINCSDGIDVTGDLGTFTNGAWPAISNYLSNNVVRNVNNGVNITVFASDTGVSGLSVNSTVTTPLTDTGSSTTFLGSNNKWFFTGTNTILNSNVDSNSILFVSGITKALRMGSDSAQSYVEGVDSGNSSFIPLVMNGSTVDLRNSNVSKLIIGSGSVTASIPVITTASTTGASGFNLPSGTAPTSPVDGDVWYDGTNLKVRLAGATKTVTVT